jgi:hypothetical protein
MMNETGLLAADVRARAAVHVEVDVEALLPEGVLAEVALAVALRDRALDHVGGIPVLAAYVDVDEARAHRPGADQRTLDDLMRRPLHDQAVLEGARLRLVGVDDDDLRAVALLRHEGPLEAGHEARPAPAAQARVLDPVGDLVGVELERLPDGGVAALRLVALERTEALVGVVLGEIVRDEGGGEHVYSS